MTDALRATLALLKDGIARRDRVGINRAATALIDQRAPLGQQWASIATLLQHDGEHDAALRALATWRAGDGAQPHILFAQAATLARAGRPGEALTCMEQVPTDFPDAVSNTYFKGTIATNMGDTDAARHALRRAVTLNPASGQSWLALAMAGPLDAPDAVALRAAAAASFASRESADSAAGLYALGKLEDECENHEAAFTAFAAGARIMQRHHSFDAAADRALVDAEIAAWDRAAIDEVRRAIVAGDPRPIFVTGLPRSGTTLVEQILASHSGIAGGAELSLFSILGRDIGGLSHRAFQIWRARGGDPQTLRSLYHHLAVVRFPAPGRIVDKTLATSRHMGLIATLFPDAPIIWVRRAPLDCAWSAFRNYFVKGIEWSWSLDTIADFFTQEDRMFAHWTSTLGDQILVVPFAELVTDNEAWTQQINAHAGLALEPAQLAPERTARTVVTNSAAQVREAVHQRGIGAAEPYRSKLGGFLDRYQPLA